jgi:DNA-binding winged helix-turn-helix (wHTH) protein
VLGVVARFFDFGPFRLDAVERRLVCAGKPMTVTPRAFDVLVALVQARGRVVSKDDLLHRIWVDAVVEESTLSQNIFTIRKALRGGSADTFIETVPKVGYRFVAPVLATAELRPTTLAVLPFKPIQTERRDESLELGIADALITRLSTLDNLVVRHMGAVRPFMALSQDPLAAGRTLRVELVLEGSVQRVADRVRATARLLDVATGQAMWAAALSEAAGELFGVLDAISDRIVRGLSRQLDGTPEREPVDRIRELTRGWSPAQFERTYAPGKWTARQILIHLAQTEMGLGSRARMALTIAPYVAQPFDQDRWVALETTTSGQEAVDALAGLNAMNRALFESLSPAQRATPFSHPEYGTLTVDWIAQLLASHLAHHLAHLEQIAQQSG